MFRRNSAALSSAWYATSVARNWRPADCITPSIVGQLWNGLRGIGLHAHVDDGRLAVGVRHEVAHVVVIVALTVVASLRGQVPSTPLSESGPVKGLPTYGLINNL